MARMSASLGAFGAMAFTIGRFGLTALLPLATLMLAVYITMALFVIVVLGAIARFAGFSIFALLRTFRDELLLVLGTFAGCYPLMYFAQEFVPVNVAVGSAPEKVRRCRHWLPWLLHSCWYQ